MRHAPGALVARYARALFRAASDLQVLPQVRADIAAITEVWRENPEFALLALNPRLSNSKTETLLLTLADRVGAHALTRNFLKLLLEKDRLEILGDLGEPFERLWRDQQGEIELAVVTAVPISDALKTTIRDHLAVRSGRKPLIIWKQDPKILGGIVVEYPDRVFDASLARKLEKLKQHLSMGV